MTQPMYEGCRRAMHVITPEGQVLRAGRASLYVISQLGWTRFARVLSLPPLVWAVEISYWIVARHRPFFSRFFFRR